MTEPTEETDKRHSLDDARQGEIILRSRASRIIFLAGIIAFVIIAVVVPLLVN